jgi:hypothetical protein
MSYSKDHSRKNPLAPSRMYGMSSSANTSEFTESSPMESESARVENPIDIDEKDKSKKPDATKIIINGKTLTVDQTSGKKQRVTRNGRIVGYVENNNPKTFISV